MTVTGSDAFRRIPARAGFAKPTGACRQCGHDIPGGDRRRTFCSRACVHEWQVRTNPGYQRAQVMARDHGRCWTCGLDTVAALACARRVFRRMCEERAKCNLTIGQASSLQHWIEIPGWAALWGKAIWEMDHVVPVAEGGGGCGLENLRTLCRWCHVLETGRLRRRLSGWRDPGMRVNLAAPAWPDT